MVHHRRARALDGHLRGEVVEGEVLVYGVAADAGDPAYGSDALTRFNGVVVLGNQISPYDVEKRDGIEYTTFNRTLFDALANEDILDMQGTMEAVSEYYSTNGDSFKGLCVPPKYQERFDELVKDIQEYYES